jgi:arsenate reductase-like glutaredoxin family protein
MNKIEYSIYHNLLVKKMFERYNKKGEIFSYEEEECKKEALEEILKNSDATLAEELIFFTKGETFTGKPIKIKVGGSHE